MNAPEGTNRTAFTLVLGIMMSFGPMSVDMYLPSLPTLAADFGASQADVQFSLSSFFIGFAAGQLFWGPVGDRFGRRLPIGAGILLFLVASIGCATAGSVAQLVGWRLAQGLGACAAPTLARAMIRDVFARDQAARMLSVMMLVMGAAPMLAPLLGGQMLRIAGWPAIFWVLAGFGAIAFAALFAIPETLPLERRRVVSALQMATGYWQLLVDRRYMGYGLCGALYLAGMFAYISGTPFVYIEIFGVPPQFYGFLFGLNIVGMMATSWINTRLVVRLGSDRMLRVGCWMAAIFGTLLAVTGHWNIGGLYGVVGPMFLFLAAMGFMQANATAGALAAFPHMAGAAAALSGMMQFAAGALSGVAVGVLADGTPGPMTAIIGLLGVSCLVVVLTMVKGRQPEPA